MYVITSGGIQTIINVTMSSLVKGVGRKPPLFSSDIEFGVSTVGLALYFYLEIKTNVDLSAVDWIPITCLVFCVSLFSLSLGVLPLTIMGERFLRNVKSLAALVAQLLSATCGLVVTKSSKLWPVILELTLHSRFSLRTILSVPRLWYCIYRKENVKLSLRYKKKLMSTDILGELKQNKWIGQMLIKNLPYIKIIMCRGLKIVLNVMQKIVNILDEKVTLITRTF